MVEEGALADLLLVDGDTLANISRHFAAILAAGVFATIASSVSGVATGALLATINEAVHTQGEALVGILAAFAGLGVVSLASEFAGNIGNSLVGQRILATLRKELSAKILRAPIAEIERFQSHRLIAILAQDVATIGGFTLNFSAVATVRHRRGLLRHGPWQKAIS